MFCLIYLLRVEFLRSEKPHCQKYPNGNPLTGRKTLLFVLNLLSKKKNEMGEMKKIEKSRCSEKMRARVQEYLK